MKQKRGPYRKPPLVLGPDNPWLNRDIPDGFRLVKADENGLLFYWTEWRLEPIQMTDSSEAVSGGLGPDHSENAVQGRVDNVIDDMQKGRVVPTNVDRLDDAVKRTRRDQAVARAIRG